MLIGKCLEVLSNGNAQFWCTQPVTQVLTGGFVFSLFFVFFGWFLFVFCPRSSMLVHAHTILEKKDTSMRIMQLNYDM